MMWNWRLIIVVPVDVLNAAEQAARAINSTGPDYIGNAFTLPLSATGLEPVTHWGLYTSATDQMIQEMATVLPQIDGAMYWRHDTQGRLTASNVTQADGQAWGMAQSLAAAELMVVDVFIG